MIWYVFPVKQGMSWEGHLSGLITGLAFALIFRKHIAQPEKYKWEQPDYSEDNDPFMRHFDENGNFIEWEPEPEAQQENDRITSSDAAGMTINYTFKEKEH
jgi:hypothetical protein